MARAAGMPDRSSSPQVDGSTSSDSSLSPQTRASPSAGTTASVSRSRRNSRVYKNNSSDDWTDLGASSSNNNNNNNNENSNHAENIYPDTTSVTGVGLGIGIENVPTTTATSSYVSINVPEYQQQSISHSNNSNNNNNNSNNNSHVLNSSSSEDPSNSTNGHHHSRQKSLTSACPPVTAPDSKLWTPRSPLASSASTLSPRIPNNVSSTPEDDKKAWGWISTSSSNNSSSKSRHIQKPSTTDDISTRRRSKSRSHRPTLAPLIRTLLGPFAHILLPSEPVPKKRPHFLWRLVSASCIIFSLLYLTSHLLSGDGPQSFSSWALDSLHSTSYYTSISPLLSRDHSRSYIGPEPLHEKNSFNIGRWWSTTNPAENPLSQFRHTSRFGKLFSKVPYQVGDNLEPFAFTAKGRNDSGSITACMYTNEAWISELPNFVKNWRGPVSLVFEDHNHRSSKERSGVLARLDNLRSNDPLIRDLVDIHILSSQPYHDMDRRREHMITNPVATNFDLNVARMFSRTEMVWMVGDPRVFPSPGLRDRLADPKIRMSVIGHGDAIVVPTFASVRGSKSSQLSLKDTKSYLGNNHWGVTSDEFLPVASALVDRYHSSLALPTKQWPATKDRLVEMVLPTKPVDPSATASASSSPDNGNGNGNGNGGGGGDGSSPELALDDQAVSDIYHKSGTPFVLYDKTFPYNAGPSNWDLWKLSANDANLMSSPLDGGGQGLGFDKKTVGGGNFGPYHIPDVHFNYGPNYVISRDAQPWCTERFSYNKAACVNQIYINGGEFWVLNDEFAYTLEPVEKNINARTDAEKLQSSIDKRLYIKYRQEVCMHYGRQLISQGRWNTPQAIHAKTKCRRTLQQWNVGLA